ncbi:thiamine pyrophosphate-binding protein, partial [Candidatus Woesearchaeota archaeon]|nr:thiamine pyrophosphate-binding protein [Candidatus Woesearchaeota archaeon]
GVLGAWLDSVPLLVLSGQSKLSETSRGYGVRQMGIDEVNIVDVVKPVTKYAVMVTDPKKIRYHLEKACHLAMSGRPGPVWLDLPLDVQVGMVDEDRLVGAAGLKKRNYVKTARKKIPVLIDLLKKSSRPVILAGNGIRIAGADKGFISLVDRMKIPVVTSRNGRDILEYNHPLLVGGIGAYGDRAANFVIQNSDLLISIGARLSPPETGCEHQFFAREAKKVIIDVDPNELRKPSAKSYLPIECDAKDFIAELLSQTKRKRLNFSPWLKRCISWKRKYPRFAVKMAKNRKFVNIYYFMKKASELAAENDVIVLDRGTAFYTTIQAWKIKGNQRIISSAGLSSAGFGLPGSIGAFIANGKNNVICISGDGGFQLNIQELATINYNRFPLKIFLLDNGGDSTVRKTQKAYFKSKFIGTDSQSGKGLADLVDVSEAYGLKVFRINNDHEIDKKLKKIFSYEDAFICVLKLDKEQYPEPRLVSAIKSDGRLVSRPLEDMYPFLDRKELRKNMIIDLVNEEGQDD